MEDQVKKTPVVLVVLAWLFVGLPWTWGVTQLWKNAQEALSIASGSNSSGCSGRDGSSRTASR